MEELLAKGMVPDCDDIDRHIFFFHGKESGPFGTKYDALSERFSVDSPDFRGMDISKRLKKAEHLTRHMEDIVVVGSSYGGLLAALLYSNHPDRFKGYVLLAPAFHLNAADEIERMPNPEYAVVIHGRQDEVVPFEASEALCSKHGVELIAVDDNHRLHGSLNIIVRVVDQLLGGAPMTD